MRPPRIKRSSLRYPLDNVLGTPAMVRLIRVLVYDVNGAVGITEATKLAGLTPPGTRKAMESLERLGVVSRVGTGRAQKYAPKENNPYLPLLREMFSLEQRQHEELLQELRNAVGIPEIKEAWLRDIPTEPSHNLELIVVAETKTINWIGNELRVRVTNIEKQFNLLIEINVFIRADKPEIPDDAVILWGFREKAEINRPLSIQTQAESEKRSLRMARAIADLIKSDPSLTQRAIYYTNRLLHEGQGMANNDISEWRQLLETYSPERLRELLVSKSSRAERLRRSSPFFSVLTPEERDRMIKLMEDDL
jgi:hypothetical protein